MKYQTLNKRPGFLANIDTANEEIQRCWDEIERLRDEKTERKPKGEQASTTFEQPKLSGLARAISANQKLQAED
jgi:hypothetical protein